MNGETDQVSQVWSSPPTSQDEEVKKGGGLTRDKKKAENNKFKFIYSSACLLIQKLSLHPSDFEWGVINNPTNTVTKHFTKGK